MKNFFFIVLVFACSSSSNEKLQLKSIETHDLAVKISEHVSEKIKRIEVYMEQLEEPMKSILKDSVEVLKKDYAYWESTIIEVSGHEHEHHEHSSHKHVMRTDLTPDMMLEIQSDLRNRIVRLNGMVKKVLDKLEINNPNTILK